VNLKIDSEIYLLEKFIEENNYKGYDPYDILKSPFFKLPILKKNKNIRFFMQQIGKRFPINLRPIFLVPKGYNPVTLGLVIEGYVNRLQYMSTPKDEYEFKINSLISELENLASSNFSGACWGYDFDWEARYASIPALKPTVVATGIITNSLFQFYNLSKNDKAKNLIISASEFVLKDLHRTYEKESFCFSYSPFDKQIVFNASMKAVRILVQTFAITKNEELINEARNAINFVMKYQNKNGAWVYSDKLNDRIDNYHTGYVLTCLKDYIDTSHDENFDKNVESGYKFYRENFIGENGSPKFFNNNMYPIDCTSAAQLILTLVKFGDFDLATNVADFMFANMFDQQGYFYFRKFKNYTIKTPMMRWSQAWMFAALTKLLSSYTKAK
jgi:hypothetical protein